MTASHKDTSEFTTSTLMALTTEWADYKEGAQRIEAMILALAKEHGLSSVLPDPAG